MNSVRYCLLFSTLLSASACAPWPLEMTSAVSGKVVDASTRQPVANARVYISAFPESTVFSSSTGEFLINPIRKWQVAIVGTDLRPNYTLVVQAKGYRSVQRNWYVGDDQSKVFELQSGAEQ